MRIITTTSGRAYYVAHTVPQIDGTLRYLCAKTKRAAEEIAETIRRDSAMVDAVKCVIVNGRSKHVR